MTASLSRRRKRRFSSRVKTAKRSRLFFRDSQTAASRLGRGETEGPLRTRGATQSSETGRARELGNSTSASPPIRQGREKKAKEGLGFSARIAALGAVHQMAALASTAQKANSTSLNVGRPNASYRGLRGKGKAQSSPGKHSTQGQRRESCKVAPFALEQQTIQRADSRATAQGPLARPFSVRQSRDPLRGQWKASRGTIKPFHSSQRADAGRCKSDVALASGGKETPHR